ncbi:MAG: type II toxin-antitoxin system HicA family toxin [Acidobacteriota bacterium]|nr:type II toxin-antitoxin system HicA family toxin [Acidobacteriota bacterium]
MPSLPVISGLEAIKVFEKAEWWRDRQRGSHVILIKLGNAASLSIPLHKELSPGTLRSLIRASGMTVDQFVDLL